MLNEVRLVWWFGSTYGRPYAAPTGHVKASQYPPGKVDEHIGLGEQLARLLNRAHLSQQKESADIQAAVCVL